MHRRHRRVTLLVLGVLGACATLAGPVAAHGGSLAPGSRQTIAIPLWLFLTTGGAAVGASFILASFVTDRFLIERLDTWRRRLAVPGDRLLSGLLSLLGLVGLIAVVAVGFAGPTEAVSNLAVLLVWAGWWAGLAIATYSVGNAWPALDPWRTVAARLPSLDRDYPANLASWPAVVGLLALVWVEVVSPLADDPRLLATVALGYSVLTVGGAVVFGVEDWFRHADPVAAVFRAYGRVAPVTRTDDGLALRLPGTGLAEPHVLTDRSEVAFVVALVWATTFDGLVATETWAAIARPVVAAGLPAAVLYPFALFVGFLAFYAAFRLAVAVSRTLTDTYLSATTLARLFAPPLLAIAAGYHLAHYLGYFVELLPALLAAATAPIAGPAVAQYAVLPPWFGALSVAAVLLGHLLAIWVAHTVAYDVFPSRLQAIRSQYPIVLVMVAYTTLSLWIVTAPSTPPPFI